MRKLTVERIREMITYDPATGALTWAKDISCRHHTAGRDCGTTTDEGYLRVQLDGEFVFGHVIAWVIHYGEWPSNLLDHKNQVKSDNWIDNIRLADSSKNATNRNLSASNTSGRKGITELPSGRWQAQIRFNGKNTYLGSFATKDEAATAYDKKAKSVFGEFHCSGIAS